MGQYQVPIMSRYVTVFRLILLFLCIFYILPVNADYCKVIGCCEGRDDECSTEFPIYGPETLCYCDTFCNRTQTDCCPDFYELCLGIKPPKHVVQPHLKITDDKCCHDEKEYDVGEVVKINCNNCTCRSVLYGFASFQCTSKRCLIEDEMIEKVNNDPAYGWTASGKGEGPLYGLTKEAGYQYRLGTLPPRDPVKAMNEIQSDAASMSIPEAFDARDKWPGLICGIQDQGDCASSWAMSTTGVASDRFSIQSNGTMEMVLSPQHLLSCNNKGQRGCTGGHLDRAWWYLRKRGVVTNDCYPYKSGMNYKMKMKKGECYIPGKSPQPLCPNPITNSGRYKTTPPYRISANEEAIQAEIMENGPVQAVFHVKDDFFMYKSGVYKFTGLGNETQSNSTGWHSVRILGWGTDKSNPKSPKPYWLCANSWGEAWGEKGLVRIARGSDECGIESFVVAVWAKVDMDMMESAEQNHVT